MILSYAWVLLERKTRGLDYFDPATEQDGVTSHQLLVSEAYDERV
jgi:hypothetical protein